MTRTVGIDAHSLIYRSFHAAAYSAQKTGADINLAPVLTKLLSSIVGRLNPDFLLAAADTGGGSFRKELCPQYKATRKPPPAELIEQIPVGLRVLKNFGIPIHSCEGFEADDVLATLAAQIKPGHKLIMVSSDRDLAALVDDRVELYLVRTGEHQLITPENARDLFGVEPARICEYKALVGDSSDNITGVPGVGPKGALKLMEACQTLDEMVQRADEFARNGKLVREHEDAMRLSYQLACMRSDVPCRFDAQAARWDADKAAKLSEA